MVKDYLVRPYRKHDLPYIIELLDTVFPNWPNIDVESQTGYWKWKFEDNPISKHNFIVAEYDEKIVGSFGLFVNKLKINDKIVLCNTGVDVSVHPDHRRKGLYNSMHKRALKLRREKGFQFSFGIETNPIIVKAHRRHGRHNLFPFKVNTFKKIKEIDLHFLIKKRKYTQLRKCLFHLNNNYNRLINYINPIHTEKNYPILEIKYFDDRITEFWSRIKDHYNYIVEKTMDYLNWRYCDIRGGKYKIKIIKENDSILGYMVLSIRKSDINYPEGYIIDMMTLPNYSYLKHIFIEDAIKYFNNHNINIIKSLAISKHSNEKTFKKHGFFKNQSLYLNYPIPTNISEELIKLENISPDRLNFTYGDYDFI
jgi:hypothetical protein